MKIIPLTNYVYFKANLIKKIGRLELPETAHEREESVTIIVIGEDVKKIKVGDKIIIRPQDIIRHPITDDKDIVYGFIREENIIAKIEE